MDSGNANEFVEESPTLSSNVVKWPDPPTEDQLGQLQTSAPYQTSAGARQAIQCDNMSVSSPQLTKMLEARIRHIKMVVYPTFLEEALQNGGSCDYHSQLYSDLGDMCKKLEIQRLDYKGDSQNWCNEFEAKIGNCAELSRRLDNFIQEQKLCTKACIQTLDKLVKLNAECMESRQKLQMYKEEVIKLQCLLAAAKKLFGVEIHCHDSNVPTRTGPVATISSMGSSLATGTASADTRVDSQHLAYCTSSEDTAVNRSTSENTDVLVYIVAETDSSGNDGSERIGVEQNGCPPNHRLSVFKIGNISEERNEVRSQSNLVEPTEIPIFILPDSRRDHHSLAPDSLEDQSPETNF